MDDLREELRIKRYLIGRLVMNQMKWAKGEERTHLKAEVEDVDWRTFAQDRRL